MTFKPSPGYNILMPKPPHTLSHLWIILTEPINDPPEVVMVNLSKKARGKDCTVELNPGEHPFIKMPTIVFYDDIKLVKVDLLVKASAIYQTFEPFTGEVLERIQRGVLLSDSVSEEISDLCRELFSDLNNKIN